MKELNVMVVGVGGQGTLLTSRIIGKTALENGFDVKLSEVHGMAQRGGSVVTFVRFGEKVYEPVVEEGDESARTDLHARHGRGEVGRCVVVVAVAPDAAVEHDVELPVCGVDEVAHLDGTAVRQAQVRGHAAVLRIVAEVLAAHP